MKIQNTYFILRHGHSLRNVRQVASSWPEKKPYPLTDRGKKEARKAAQKAQKEKINLIFYSDLLRTKQTAQIVAKKLSLKAKPDKRLREINVGIFNGRPVEEIGRFWDKEKKLSTFDYYKKRFKKAPPRGENYCQIEKRFLSFIKETESKYKGKNILLVSHQRPLTLLEKAIYGYNLKKFIEIIKNKKEIKTGQLKKLI